MADNIGAIELVKIAIFYTSYLYFPAAIFLLWATIRYRTRWRVGFILALAGISVLAYARFVEPRLLLTHAHDHTIKRCMTNAGSIRLAVFADTHFGLFANAMPAKRIVKAINKTQPDAVVIAGDFTYFLAPDYFETVFKPLSDITAPVYAVLGNHDVGLPGPNLRAPLRNILPGFGINIIDNEHRTVKGRLGQVSLTGLSDLWEGEQAMSLLSSTLSTPDMPRLVLTHNPETILETPDQALDLLLAGHTHGGQIYIPGVTCALLDLACAITRRGFKRTPKGYVFVTSGTGMVGLPMRFGVPPSIDVIDITYKACTD